MTQELSIGVQFCPPRSTLSGDSVRAARAGRGCGDGGRAGCLVIVTPALEALAVVFSFDDIAVVCEAIEESGRHFGVSEDAWPFAEGEIGGDDD